MKKFKALLLFGAVLFFTQPVFAQSEAKMQRQSEACEKLFGEKMKQLQENIESKKMSPKEANDFVQTKIESLRKQNPECFPGYDPKSVVQAEKAHQQEVRSKKKNHGTAAKKIKIDLENLSDGEINKIDTAYRSAQKECREELKSEVKKIRATASKAKTGAERLKLKKKIDKETRLMVHECTMEKMVARF